MPIKQAIPVLRVADVARSMAWYCEALGFLDDTRDLPKVEG